MTVFDEVAERAAIVEERTRATRNRFDKVREQVSYYKKENDALSSQLKKKEDLIDSEKYSLAELEALRKVQECEKMQCGQKLAVLQKDLQSIRRKGDEAMDRLSEARSQYARDLTRICKMYYNCLKGDDIKKDAVRVLERLDEKRKVLENVSCVECSRPFATTCSQLFEQSRFFSLQLEQLLHPA